MVPAFGWHPWFAHMLYFDDAESEAEGGKEEQGGGARGALTGEAKLSHYASVLIPHRERPSESDISTFLSLPDPLPISTFLAHTRRHLETHPLALIGEIGLDRAFRIPEALTSDRSAEYADFTPGGREGRRLTPFRCSPAHQKEVFRRQLALAGEMGRAVSVHGVQAHGMVFEVLREFWVGREVPQVSKRAAKKRREAGETATDPSTSTQPEEKLPYPPRICLHSFSGSSDVLRQYLSPSIPVAFFFSFSTAVNLGDDVGAETPESFVQVVSKVPDGMVLVESDLHTAGEDMDDRMENIVRRACKVKGWGLEEGVRTLGANWTRFVFGER